MKRKTDRKKDKTNLQEVIAERMKSLRKQSGLLIKEVSKKTGISISLISQIEKCTAWCSLETLQKIADSFDVNILSFFSKQSVSLEKARIAGSSRDNSYSQELIAERIGYLRKQSGLTLKQVSKKTGLSVAFISQLETIQVKSSIRTLQKLAESFDTNIEFFFSEPDVGKDEPMRKKMTIEEIQEIARKKGGRCLSKEYLGLATHLLWRCKKGHKWKACPIRIKRGLWCPYCRRERRMIEKRKRKKGRPNISETIAERLLALRKQRGLTIRQAGVKTGLSSSLFSQVENSTSNCSIITLKKIADSFGISINYFFAEPGVPSEGGDKVVTALKSHIAKLKAENKDLKKELVSLRRSGAKASKSRRADTGEDPIMRFGEILRRSISDSIQAQFKGL